MSAPPDGNEGPHPPSSIPPRPVLFLVLEGQRPLVGGARVILAELLQVKLGRGADRCFTRDGEKSHKAHLAVPDAQMSTLHARIYSEGSNWYIEDLGSRTGTVVDGERLAYSSPRLLRNGALIGLSATLFLFRDAVPCSPDDGAYLEAESLPEHRFGIRSLLPTSAGASDASYIRRLTSALSSSLLNYDHPLSIRELEKAPSDAMWLEEAPMKEEVIDGPAPASDEETVELKEGDVALRAQLIASLKEHRGNITHVATALGRTRMQVHRWLRRWSIDSELYRK